MAIITTMSRSPIPVENDGFEPSAEQLLRRKSLRRYNWLALWLPLGVLIILVLAVLVSMIWLSFEGMPQMDRWRVFVSAMADTTIILSTIGLTLSCLLGPGLGIGLMVYGRNQKWAPINRLQQLLWQLEGGLTRVQSKVDQVAARSAAEVIERRSALAYWEALLKWFKYWITGR